MQAFRGANERTKGFLAIPQILSYTLIRRDFSSAHSFLTPPTFDSSPAR